MTSRRPPASGQAPQPIPALAGGSESDSGRVPIWQTDENKSRTLSAFAGMTGGLGLLLLPSPDQAVLRIADLAGEVEAARAERPVRGILLGQGVGDDQQGTMLYRHRVESGHHRPGIAFALMRRERH